MILFLLYKLSTQIIPVLKKITEEQPETFYGHLYSTLTEYSIII